MFKMAQHKGKEVRAQRGLRGLSLHRATEATVRTSIFTEYEMGSNCKALSRGGSHHGFVSTGSCWLLR